MEKVYCLMDHIITDNQTGRKITIKKGEYSVYIVKKDNEWNDYYMDYYIITTPYGDQPYFNDKYKLYYKTVKDIRKEKLILLRERSKNAQAV